MLEDAGVVVAIRRSVAQRGLAGTVQRCLAEPVYRFRDWRFDRKFHVRTAGIIEVERLDIDDFHKAVAVWYEPVRLHAFDECMGMLPVRHEEFVFVDFGSGKGRALFLASGFPFKRIVGVELSPNLCRIAAENIATYRSPAQKCRQLEVVCGDAASYLMPTEPTVFFFYNPFGAEIMRGILNNLQASLAAHPRSVFVVLYNPRLDELVGGSAFLKQYQSNGRCTVYRSVA